MIVVTLTYFRGSGKYYTDGDFNYEPDNEYFKVHEIVSKMNHEGKLPGISYQD